MVYFIKCLFFNNKKYFNLFLIEIMVLFFAYSVTCDVVTFFNEILKLKKIIVLNNLFDNLKK